MRPRTRWVTREPPVTPVWFMVVDYDFSRTLGDPYSVNVPSGGSVLNLQQEIKALGWDEFEGVIDVKLKVWKLRTPQPAREVKKEGYLASVKPDGGISDEEMEMELRETKARRKAKAMQKAKAALRLLPSDEISSYLKEPAPHNRIQVLVQLPVLAEATVASLASRNDYPSKRQRLADDANSSWLKEVQSKIWNKERLVLELFRKVEVTQAHYTELQRRLKEQHPGRDLPEYDGREHNVGGVKLDFLRSITSSSPQLPDSNEDRVDNGDGPEASNEDDFEINSYFPFTLSFLDLSTLGLKEKVPDRLPLPLFLRQDYDDISVLIEKEPRSKQGSVVVSGQPGTGKTAYLHLRMIQFMIEGCPFLYQASDGTVYHVNENGVEVIQVWLSDEVIVAFVDGDERNYDPKHMLRRDTVQIILATSPRGADRGWMEQVGGVTTFATELWSPCELFLTGMFLCPFDISLKLLRKSTSYFGYNPRLCFRAACSIDVLERIKDGVMSQISRVATGGGNILQMLHSSRSGDPDSHTIFEISPMPESRSLPRCRFGAVSQWALDLLLKEYETRRADEVAPFYDYISGMSEAASLWGHVFKRQVLNHFEDIQKEQEFRIRGLTSPGQMTWTYRGPIRRFNFPQDSDFIDEITKAIQNRKPLHLVPLVRNFPSVDSIIYDPDEVLTCIQITASRNHDFLVSGLQHIQSLFKRCTPLEGLYPSKDRPWRLVFVVPPSDEAYFKSHRLKGDTALDEWAGSVHQYVLGLDVLRKRSTVEF